VLAVLAGLTPFATPYGFTIIDYYREFAGNPAMAGMAAEWTSPRFPSFVFFQFAIPVAVALVAVLVAGRRGYRPSPVLIAFAAVTAAAGAIESGSIIWFGIAAATLVADVLRYLIPAQAQPRSITLALGVAAAGLAVIVAARVGGRSTEGYNTLVPARTVAAVTAYASHHPCTTIIADNLSSAALLWRSPALAGRLAFDARLEQYSPTALGRWQAFIAGDSLGLDHLGGGDDILVADRYYASVLVRRLERFPARARIVRTADTVAVVTQTRPRPGGVCGAPA
jgi:hypothetical protein